MTGGQERPPGFEKVEEQVEVILDDTTTSVGLLSRVDFDFVRDRDQYADWHAATPMEPMIRALLFKKLQNLSYSELHRHLDNYTEAAEPLGFNEVPARTTFGRAWRDRFDDDLRSLINQGAELIRELGRQNGRLIGSRAIEPDDKQDSSKRTKDRFIAEKAKEVTEAMQRLVFPVFEFDRAENARYETDAFLELQSHLGLSHSAAESGTKLFDQDTSRDHGSPDADTHLHNIKRLSREEVATMLNEAIGRMVSETHRQLDASRRIVSSRPVDVAVDMTYVAYYGEREGLEMVYGAPPTKSYEWCYKFATAAIVGNDVKLTLAVRPVQKGNDLVGTILRDVVEKAKEFVDINVLYADSEFCTVESFRAMADLGVDYIIPSPKNQRVKREIEDMYFDVEVRRDYVMYGPVSDGRTSQPGHTNLVLLPSTKNPETTVAFTTNLDLNYLNERDRVLAKRHIDRYRRRWGIENSYKTIKDFLAWTTSKEFVVRFFYFGFAVLLYNMWLLVDLLVQLSLNVYHRYKPRVTAKRFLNLVRKQLAEPG